MHTRFTPAFMILLYYIQEYRKLAFLDCFIDKTLQLY